ncbi:transmembrane protein, putative [Medicago truncatula]|uniref:Transmembrane protein, putative n=1 Tax=Medicago truncatula TaxID=3880 RepID=G7KJS6_MEDTR|nr:transmembrane protein, putative [Medicago truncatula]
MGSGWVPISPLPVPYPCFEIGENPNPYPNSAKAGNTRQNGFGMGGYPRLDPLIRQLLADQQYRLDALFMLFFRSMIQLHADFPATFAAGIPAGIFAGNVLAGKSVGKALKALFGKNSG